MVTSIFALCNDIKCTWCWLKWLLSEHITNNASVWHQVHSQCTCESSDSITQSSKSFLSVVITMVVTPALPLVPLIFFEYTKTIAERTEIEICDKLHAICQSKCGAVPSNGQATNNHVWSVRWHFLVMSEILSEINRIQQKRNRRKCVSRTQISCNWFFPLNF